VRELAAQFARVQVASGVVGDTLDLDSRLARVVWQVAIILVRQSIGPGCHEVICGQEQAALVDEEPRPADPITEASRVVCTKKIGNSARETRATASAYMTHDSVT
jgi:hypothetical protein